MCTMILYQFNLSLSSFMHSCVFMFVKQLTTVLFSLLSSVYYKYILPTIYSPFYILGKGVGKNQLDTGSQAVSVKLSHSLLSSVSNFHKCFLFYVTLYIFRMAIKRFSFIYPTRLEMMQSIVHATLMLNF